MDEFLSRPWILRIVSVVLAVILWWQVGGPNKQAHTQRTFDNVTVHDFNLPPGLALDSITPDTVSITVSGTRRELDQLSAQDISASVDLTGAVDGQARFYVRSSVPTGTTVEGVEPQQVVVQLEQVVTRDVPVQVVVSGQPAQNYKASSPSLPLDKVQVKGPASVVSRVKQALARIDIDGASKDVLRQVTLVPVDAAGNRVGNVQLLPASLSLTVPVSEQQVSQPLQVSPVVTGAPANGYTVTGTTVDPQQVTVTGPVTALNQMYVVKTKPVDISGANQTVTVNASLDLPDSMSSGTKSVKVTVTITASNAGSQSNSR